MASPSSGASATGVPAWVLLDLTPLLTDLHSAGEADVLLKLVPPPGISTALIDRAMLSDAAASDGDDTPRCRVEGADASGRLLLALPSPRAPGESHLVVCRPVASRSRGSAEGKARPLPAFPEALGIPISPASPAGIVAEKGGDGFVVAQVHKAPSSTPSPVVALAVYFSSDGDQWAVKDVPGEDRWRDFAPTRVLSHDRGVAGDRVRLVFFDSRRGLLPLHPRVASASQFVDLPRLPEARGRGGIQDASVDSSDGRLVCVLFYDEPEGLGTMVGLWCLSEDDLRWDRHLDPASDLYYDEVFSCDHRLPRGRVRGIGPVDPNRVTRLFFLVGSSSSAVDRSYSSFAVDVRRTAMVLDRASLVDDIQACNASESALVCPIGQAPRTWRPKFKETVEDAKQAGKVAMGWMQGSREHLHKVAPALQVVGSFFNLSCTATMVTGAKTIDTLNTIVGFGESASAWVSHNRHEAPPVWWQYPAVSTIDEATRAIQFWVEMKKPAGMTIDPAPEVTADQLELLRQVFIDEGAEDLIGGGFDYEMVDRAPRF